MNASHNTRGTADIADELAIRSLVARFSDACIRGDIQQFKETWMEEGRWLVGQPYETKCEGIDAILSHLHFLRNGLNFFTQLVTHGVLELDGDRAMMRSPVWEMASGPADHFYNNLGLYHDVVVKTEGKWRFLERRYEYIWLSTDPFPGVAIPRQA